MVIDWVVTIVGAVLIVFAVKTWVVNPYRIPSPSMEPTLHCALPEPDCEASTSDRVLANRFIYHFREPRRGEIVVFTTPKLALQKCGSQGTFVKRLIGVPGDVWEEQSGVVYINGKRLNEPYIQATRRDSQTLTLRDIPPAEHLHPHPEGLLPDDGRQPELLLRLPPLGPGPAKEPDRQGRFDVLATQQSRHSIKREPRRSGALDQR